MNDATIDAAIEEERLADVLEFARFDVGAALRDADARRTARTPEARKRLAEAEARNRRLAARAIVGPVAPEWVAELIAKHGPAFFEKGDGMVLRIASRLAFGEERADALELVTRVLLGRGVGVYVVAVLLEAWACRYTGPVPHEEEILEIVARVAQEQKTAEGRG
jgi:hypothetical protein